MKERQKPGFFLMVFGAFIALCGWSMFGQGKKSVYEIDNWVDVKAEILTSKVETVSMHSSSSRGPSNVTGWEPAITYRYSFKNKEYEGNRYTIGSSASQDYDKIVSIVKAHPAGGSVTIHVNPENPSEAVLSRADKQSSFVLFVVACVLIPVGCIMVVAGSAVYWKYRNNVAESPGESETNE